MTPDRPVGSVTRQVLATVRDLGGPVEIDPTPQEVTWNTPLDEDSDHARYDRDRVADYFAAATQAALVLGAFRAPYRGRSTPVNAWWGSFDLAVNLFSGLPAEPPSTDFIMRNAMDVQEVAVGWWPGDARHPTAAFYAYAHPAPDDFSPSPVLREPGALGCGPGRVPPGMGRRPGGCRPPRPGPRFRPFGVPPRLPGVLLGPAPGRQRGRIATTDQLSGIWRPESGAATGTESVESGTAP